MSNPFRQTMPLSTDMKIRVRLWRAWVSDHKALSVGALLVPAMAAWMFLVVPANQVSIETLVAEIRAAQIAEQERAEDSIYHVVREITEGQDKSQYVAAVLGVETKAAARTDRIETYQHSDTALALIESNGTNQPFEAFLSREHEDGALSLHHFGPAIAEVGEDREVYDEAHDLASLYTAYTSLERPDIPLLSEKATFVGVDTETNQAHFKTVLNDAITVDSFVDLDTKLIVKDVIYVSDGDDTFEMTQVAYVERDVIPAEEFETIFDPTQFAYEVIDTLAS